jgi:hypothetical protein
MNDKTVCNEENGSFSQLFGRKCWVADSMLSLVQSFVDEKGTTPEAAKLATDVENYCKELRQMNQEYWDDTITTR